MSGSFRTAQGGRIDRARAVRFSFDGKTYRGYVGDTLASALLANGVSLMGRSFKYHRPRGVMTAGSEEPSALVTVDRGGGRRTPNLPATQVEIHDGLIAHSQNRWPSLAFDIGEVNDLIARFIPAGFYYKTFMWPRKGWDRLYEPLIRQAAGLGEAPGEADPDRYLNRYAHCEVLVVGAGPAGLAAALTAADSGARVIVCDEQPEPGGSLLLEMSATIEGRSAQAWLAEAVAVLDAHPRVTLLRRTQAFGYYAHNLIGLVERLGDHLAVPAPGLARERLWQVRAKEVVIAAGAIERPLVFPGNDRPGVMLAEAARTYLNRFGVLAGRRVAIVTATDAAYRCALELHEAGAEISAVIDMREDAPGDMVAAARRRGLPVRFGMAVLATRGRRRVSGLRVAPIRADGRFGASEIISCDAVLMSGGFTPSVHLVSQSRAKLRWDEPRQAFLPSAPTERERSAGACRGLDGLPEVLADGAAAGAEAARAAGFEVTARSFATAGAEPCGGGLVGASPRGRGGGKAFVDWQNDVTVEDLKLAAREGFRSVEHIKRYTTTGMATDQGKTSNINALGAISAILDIPAAELGLTTFRAPFTPVTFGSLAGMARGPLFDPVRTTPIHGWAEAQGAVFEDVGAWRRARYFPRPGEDMNASVMRECAEVRDAAGLFDASTLGKIEVVGPDAAEFLDRLYINAWKRLAVGRCRYGVLLGEDGFIRDDGVVGRLAEDRFHLTTTTGGAARVLNMMEDYRQTEWPELDVWLTSTTEQWVVIAVQGPRARDILAPLTDIDLSPEAFPHMSVATGRILGVPTRLFRVSFTGEIGYEVNVPASHGLEVWKAIWTSGRSSGLTPYGTEAMHVLRAEKGYIIVGQETDGTTTPHDVGLGWAIGKAKPDFIGRRSLQRPAMSEPDRRQLVGLITEDPHLVLEEGAQILAQPSARPAPSLGHVTSSYASAALGRSIALAMLSDGAQRLGERLYVAAGVRSMAVTVVSPVFYDPEGAKVNG